VSLCCLSFLSVASIIGDEGKRQRLEKLSSAAKSSSVISSIRRNSIECPSKEKRSQSGSGLREAIGSD